MGKWLDKTATLAVITLLSLLGVSNIKGAKAAEQGPCISDICAWTDCSATYATGVPDGSYTTGDNYEFPSTFFDPIKYENALKFAVSTALKDFEQTRANPLSLYGGRVAYRALSFSQIEFDRTADKYGFPAVNDPPTPTKYAAVFGACMVTPP